MIAGLVLRISPPVEGSNATHHTSPRRGGLSGFIGDVAGKGVAAALIGTVPAVVFGGIATIVIAAAWTRLFPDLTHVDRLDELRPVAEPI